MYRKTFIVFSFLLMFAMVFSAVGSASAQSSGNGGLSKHNRELLAQALVNGQPTVTLLIASQPGANKIVASGITKLGGNVRYQEDTINYISAIVPTNKVNAVTALNGV